MSGASRLLLVLLLLSACTVPSDLLEGRPCPCVDGWTCDTASGTCVRVAGSDAGRRDGNVDGGNLDGANVDAAGRDAGDRDSGNVDAGDTDASSDAGAPTEPPRVPNDCWIQPTMCDWSDPTSFEMVPGAGSVLGSISVSGNPSFSPDGCSLLFDAPGRLAHIARRSGAGMPFGLSIPIAGVEIAGSREIKASLTPNGLEILFGSDRGGPFTTTWRAERTNPTDPFGGAMEIAELSFRTGNNWDGILAPHGLRYYWSPSLPGGQDIYVGERDALGEAFRMGTVIPELQVSGSQAEAALSADGRLISFITSGPPVTSGSHFVYATRGNWRGTFGVVREVPGALLATGTELETTMSADACEAIARRGASSVYLVYQAR